MKRLLKILAALVSLAVLGFGVLFAVYLRDKDFHCDTITLSGTITSEKFVKVRECLTRSAAPRKTFVIEDSPGGDNLAALAFGILIHKHQWDVEIVDSCGSACATFIFPAGRTKYLHRHSLLMFHGGPYQENMLVLAQQADQPAKAPLTPLKTVTFGEQERENTVVFTRTLSDADLEVRVFLTMAHLQTAAEFVTRLRSASDQFYRELGVNRLLPTYGQVGGYEASYKSYEHHGFIYDLDSLRRLGVTNIELKEAEWRPDTNPGYAKVYEVRYP